MTGERAWRRGHLRARRPSANAQQFNPPRVTNASAKAPLTAEVTLRVAIKPPDGSRARPIPRAPRVAVAVASQDGPLTRANDAVLAVPVVGGQTAKATGVMGGLPGPGGPIASRLQASSLGLARRPVEWPVGPLASPQETVRATQRVLIPTAAVDPVPVPWRATAGGPLVGTLPKADGELDAWRPVALGAPLPPSLAAAAKPTAAVGAPAAPAALARRAGDTGLRPSAGPYIALQAQLKTGLPFSRSMAAPMASL